MNKSYKAQPAPTIKNACQCSRCQSACSHKPGWFRPEQIAPLARRMGLTVQELFDRHLSVDWWNGTEEMNGEDIFVLSPRLVGRTGGEMFPAEPHGVCHWFKDGACGIHKLGKPDECAFAHHALEGDVMSANRFEIVKSWMPKQRRIQELLGRKPEAEVFWGGIGGILSALFG
jgi:hypothetical protein